MKEVYSNQKQKSNMKTNLIIATVLGLIVGSITTKMVIESKIDYRSGQDFTKQGKMMNLDQSIDAWFIKDMIPHHQGAIDMAKLALEKAKTDNVKTLAQNIIVAQQKEIDDMTGWYSAWFGSLPTTEASTTNQMPGMMDHSGSSTEHMMSMTGDLEALAEAKDFDQTFITQMIPHHEMAIMMAKMLLTFTQRPEMINLANNIITSQTAEITAMKSWLK